MVDRTAETSKHVAEKRDGLDPIEVPAFGTDGSSAGSKTLTPGEVRNYPNYAVMKEAVRHYQGHLRRGTASTKTRGEIHGSPRKPWRQKGTGRARSGSKKSPIWRGGGVVFGPKPRVYDYGLPKKQRRLATRHAMLSKFVDGEASVIDQFDASNSSTGALRKVLSKLDSDTSCVIAVDSAADKQVVSSVVRASRNLPRVVVMAVRELNALALLKHQRLVVTSAAFDEIQSNESQIGGGA